ncbi:MAG TPA: helix-turn-helix transcriptional regulator [Bdellovibrionales bacterium]|nr:helix-turn-helix transcriptional regulator [Bdellovibrionales bacterium]
MVKTERTYSLYTCDAAVLLGKYIQLGRKQRRLTERELAERAGISRATLQKIEKGDLKVEIGIVFETAALVGVKLFETDGRFTQSISAVNDKLALLPKNVRKSLPKVDDAF